MTNDPQILVYFTNQPEQIVGGDPLCLHIQDSTQREQMIVQMAKMFEARVARLPNGDAMIVFGI